MARHSKRADFIAAALSYDGDACVIWPFAVRASSGYGAHSTKVNGVTLNYDVHNYVCRKAHGEPPQEGDVATHSCDTKLCISKRHLRWRSQAANMAEMVERRRAIGGGRGRQRFHDRERAAIAASPLGLVAAGRVFGADPTHIAKIRREMR